MSRLAQSAMAHGQYVVQSQVAIGDSWQDADLLSVGAAEEPIDVFGQWLEGNRRDARYYRLVEVLDEQDPD